MPMKKQEKQDQQNEFYKDDRHHLFLWVIVLLLLLCLSSCGLMYHLGKRAKERAEPNRQTIQVEPEVETRTTLSIYGVARYTDGTPCSNHTVRLHSTPKTTVTGADGSFFFYDVEHGVHTLSVLDQKGNEKATMNLQISEHNDKSLQYVKISQRDQHVHFEIPVNTILLNLNLEMDEQNHELNLAADGVTAALSEGRVLTSSGSVQAKENEAVVFAAGHVMLSDGTVFLADGEILFPDQRYLPKNAGSVLLPAGVTGENGFVRLADGTGIDQNDHRVTLPNGIVIHPNHTVEFPDGSILEIPDYGGNAYLVRKRDSGLIGNGMAGSRNVGVVSEEGQKKTDKRNIQEAAMDFERAENPDTSGITGGSGSSGGSGNSSGSESSDGTESSSVPESSGNPESSSVPVSSSGSGGSGGSGSSSGSESSDNSGSAKPTEAPGPVEIGDVKTGKLWKQMATIDLFTDLDGKQVYEVLFPGIEGRYDFYICNTMKTVTYMTVTVEEENDSRNGGTLPLEYKILDENGKEISGNWKDATQLKAFSVTLQPDQNVNYSIRWRWPYERTDSAGNSQDADAYDTNLAISAERSHKLRLVIHIEQ